MLGHWFIEIGENMHFLYAVSKHAVTALTEALRRVATLKKAPIKISVSTWFIRKPKSFHFVKNEMLIR